MTTTASTTAEPVIEVEPGLAAPGEAPNDSAYDDEVNSYTTSLASSVYNYKIENGRRYHAYKEGQYIYPNDEKESDRLDIMHKMTEVMLGDKLFAAPIAKHPQRILDIGTGTGIWAMEMGDKYPHSDILGNDLSPIQPKWVPPNVHFEVDDVEAPWTYNTKFDFIHSRYMGNAIKDWRKLAANCFQFTAPGGYTEFLDLDLAWKSPDGSLTEDMASLKFNNVFLDTCAQIGQDACPGPKLEGYLKDAGFENVVAEKFVIPVGTWPKDKQLKAVGAWNYLQINEGLEGFVMALFTRRLGYTQKECEVICAKVRSEMRNQKMHAYMSAHVAYGQKPPEKQSDPKGTSASPVQPPPKPAAATDPAA